MTLTTTFRKLRSADACKSRYKFLRAALKGVKDTEPINLLTILETNGLNDALWALRATTQNCDRVARLMAADFAEEVLPIWHKHYPSDTRLAEAIKAARDFANRLITNDQRDAAGAASWNAARDAAAVLHIAAARAAARAAAGAASWDAAWNAASAAAGASAGAASWNAAEGASWNAAKDAAEGKQAAIFASYLREDDPQ